MGVPDITALCKIWGTDAREPVVALVKPCDIVFGKPNIRKRGDRTHRKDAILIVRWNRHPAWIFQ